MQGMQLAANANHLRVVFLLLAIKNHYQNENARKMTS